MADAKISDLAAVTDLLTADEYVLARSGASKKITGANLRDAIASDPIFDLFGAPDTTFEFETSSLTGLTALSPTPDAANAHTTIPHHYYLLDDAGSFAAVGHYATAPSAPFTVVGKLSGHNLRTGNHAGGIFVGVATPGVMACLNVQLSTSAIAQTYTNPTTFSGNIAAAVAVSSARPVFLAIRATSSTSFDFYFSSDGRIWQTVAAAHNPGVTIASVGIEGIAQADRFALAFDYLRIWNSSKTFPGI